MDLGINTPTSNNVVFTDTGAEFVRMNPDGSIFVHGEKLNIEPEEGKKLYHAIVLHYNMCSTVQNNTP